MTWQTKQNECAPCKDSGQPGPPPCQINDFSVRTKKDWIHSHPLRAQQRLWSAWADAQADLSLCSTHTFVGFVIVGFVMINPGFCIYYGLVDNGPKIVQLASNISWQYRGVSDKLKSSCQSYWNPGTDLESVTWFRFLFQTRASLRKEHADWLTQAYLMHV